MNDVSLIIGHNSFWSALAGGSRYDPFPMPRRINNFFQLFWSALAGVSRYDPSLIPIRINIFVCHKEDDGNSDDAIVVVVVVLNLLL